jgi:HSP20 family protein
MRSLITYTPNRLSLFDDMDRLFRSFFNDVPYVSHVAPSVDLREEEGRYVLEAELPGLSEKDIEVKVDDDLLTISSAKEEKKEEKKNGYIMRERRNTSFKRSFVLPKDVDREKIEASFKNGLLKLEFHKTEQAKSRKIDVKKA